MQTLLRSSHAIFELGNVIDWQVCNELGTRVLKSDLKSTIIPFFPANSSFH